MIGHFLQPASYIYYNQDQSQIEYLNGKFTFKGFGQQKEEIEEIKRQLLALIENFNLIDVKQATDIGQEILIKMQSSLVDAIYIPAERMIISLLAKVNFGIQSAGISLPQFIIDYGAVFENARQEIKFATFPEFNLHYLFSDGRDNIKWNGSSVTLSESSTGLQSLFPLLLVIKSYSVNGPRKMNLLFIIEEPELNLYPATQKKLEDIRIAFNAPASCVENGILQAEEDKKKFKIQISRNLVNSSFCRIHVDGGLLPRNQDRKKCDYWFRHCKPDLPTNYLVEFKGSHIKEGFAQIVETIAQVREKDIVLPKETIHGIIVANRVPLSGPEIQILKERFKKDYGADFLLKSREFVPVVT